MYITTTKETIQNKTNPNQTQPNKTKNPPHTHKKNPKKTQPTKKKHTKKPHHQAGEQNLTWQYATAAGEGRTSKNKRRPQSWGHLQQPHQRCRDGHTTATINDIGERERREGSAKGDRKDQKRIVAGPPPYGTVSASWLARILPGFTNSNNIK